MGQILHKRARTTQAIRTEIRTAKGSLLTLAKRFNVNPKTIQKWRKREASEDLPMGNGRANSVLTKEEETLICELRKKTWLPLDDLFDILKPKIPNLSRSNLHRCLQSYGISRVPEEVKEKKQGKGKFRTYEIGFLHIDITDFWLQKKKYSLFVAIDRVSKLCIAELYENKTMESALDFLDTVFQFFPYHIHRILTDNGLQFTYRALPANKRPRTDTVKEGEGGKEEKKEGKTSAKGVLKRHPFTQKCMDKGIKHKLTKFFSPQTNGQVERMNKTLKDATIKMFHYDTVEQFKVNLHDFLNYYNCSKKLRAIGRMCPYDFLKEKYRMNPKLFTKNLDHHCMGLDT